MKIIKSIINDLLDTDKSLMSPLLKTKLLAKKLNNSGLYKWVDNELVGYENNEDLPRYRYALGHLKGDYTINGRQIVKNQPIMASAVDKEFSDFVNRTPINMSIESIESLLKEESTGPLSLSLPAEILKSISDAYRAGGNPGFQLLTASIDTSRTSLVQALSEIRSKLLDLITDVEIKYGDMDLDELVKEKSFVNKIIIESMQNNIIDGDGNIINTGKKSNITNSVKINKGDIDSLSRVLRDNNVEDADISEIIEIVTNEEPDFKTKKLGTRTSKWINKMFGKAVDGSWQIGIGAAGDLLASVINNYYGI